MLRRLLTPVILAFPIWAFAYDSVTFITAQDRFTVNKTAQRFTLDGKSVPSSLFSRLDPVLTGPVTNDCPALSGKPTLTAQLTTGQQTEKREFFLQRNVVRSGDKCLWVSGDGLFFLPLHRSWLIGPFHEGVKLQSPLVIQNGGAVMASLTKKDGEWVDTNERTTLDWDFFSRFEQSLVDYRITYHVLPGAGAGKPVVTMTSGREKYKFIQLAPKFGPFKDRDANGSTFPPTGDFGSISILLFGAIATRATSRMPKRSASTRSARSPSLA